MTEAEVLDYISSKIKQNGKRSISGDVINIILTAIVQLINDSGGIVNWGDIEGTIADQLDLIAAFDEKLNKDGSNADADVDLGAFAIHAKAGKINGTGGNGKLGFKHQSAAATATGSESVLYAGSAGLPLWKNDGLTVEQLAYQSVVDAKISSTEKGSANGVVPLNSSSLIDSTYLPSYVDDVLEYANFASLPGTGVSGKIYVTLDTNLTYRWSGSAYVEISASLALGETSSTAYRGDRGKSAYDHSQATGNPHGTTASDVGAPSGSGTSTGTNTGDETGASIRTKLGQTTWTDYSATSTIVGWSSFTTKIIEYRMLDANTILIFWNLIGTSDSATTTFTIPSNATNTVRQGGIYSVNSGGGGLNGSLLINSGSNVINLYQSITGSAFSATATKQSTGQLIIKV